MTGVLFLQTKHSLIHLVEILTGCKFSTIRIIHRSTGVRETNGLPLTVCFMKTLAVFVLDGSFTGLHFEITIDKLRARAEAYTQEPIHFQGSHV